MTIERRYKLAGKEGLGTKKKVVQRVYRCVYCGKEFTLSPEVYSGVYCCYGYATFQLIEQIYEDGSIDDLRMFFK